MAEEAHVKHAFKKRHFARPTRCYYCSQLIWGVGKNGFRCKECGYNVHLNECVAKAANRTSCTPGKEFPAPFKPMVGARITKVKGLIQRKSTSDIASYVDNRSERSSSLSKSSQQPPTQSRRDTTAVAGQKEEQKALQQAQSTPAGLQYRQQPNQPPVSFSQAPAMFTAPTIQKLPSQDTVTRKNHDMAAAIAEQQRYIASLQQQITAHQSVLYQSSAPGHTKRAPMARPVFQATYSPAPGYVVQQPVVVYGLDGVGSSEAPPPYEPPAAATSLANPPAYVQMASVPSMQYPHGGGAAAPTREGSSPASSTEAQPGTPAQHTAPLQQAPSARAARRAPLRTSATAEPVDPTPTPAALSKVSVDADTIRVQRKSSTADVPSASKLEEALRDLQQAPDVCAPLEEFNDLVLPGMETISFSSGESLEVLQAIAQQYEAKKRAAEAELSAMQAAVAQPPQESAPARRKEELTTEERIKLAQEVEGWLAKEIASQYPSENRISKLLAALKDHLQPIASLKKDRPDISALIGRTREHDMRAGEMLTVPPLDDSEWLYEGASDSESDEDFYFVEDRPSDMALDPLC